MRECETLRRHLPKWFLRILLGTAEGSLPSRRAAEWRGSTHLSGVGVKGAGSDGESSPASRLGQTFPRSSFGAGISIAASPTSRTVRAEHRMSNVWRFVMGSGTNTARLSAIVGPLYAGTELTPHGSAIYSGQPDMPRLKGDHCG